MARVVKNVKEKLMQHIGWTVLVDLQFLMYLISRDIPNNHFNESFYKAVTKVTKNS